MKNLYLLRHAKSSWDDSALPDFERPLNARGRRGAALLGKALAERSVRPEIVLCSPALRARETIELLLPRLGYPEDRVLFVDSLYLAPKERLREAVAGLNDSFSSVLFCCHNPGIEDLAAYYLPGEARSFPTAGFLELRFDCSSWAEARPKLVTGHHFLSPKQLGGE